MKKSNMYCDVCGQWTKKLRWNEYWGTEVCPTCTSSLFSTQGTVNLDSVEDLEDFEIEELIDGA